MSDRKKKYHNDDDQDQSQKQAEAQAQAQAQLEAQAQLQGQAQGQGQGQGQGQYQFAVQGVESYNESENKNENENKNESSNENENKNENVNEVKNEVENKLDNSVDNDVDNKVENTVENKVENTVEVKVDVKVDLDLDAFERPVDNDAIDIDEITDIDGSVVMPDVVTQSMNNGNQFNIDQVNNLVDKDFLWSAEVKNDGKFELDQKAEGGENKFDDPKIEIKAGDGATIGDGLQATADGIASSEAFTQNIVMGANIQFNQIDIQAAGHDLYDDHSV